MPSHLLHIGGERKHDKNREVYSVAPQSNAFICVRDAEHVDSRFL